MNVVGIIAEYNPFHNGHKLQIDYAREVLKADYVIVAMSGSFTQRGTISCMDKYTRAKAALLNGADVIFEIPAIFASASAKEYAACGVQLLASTGVVNSILFGAECDNIDVFMDSAKKFIELEKTEAYQNKIKELMATGISYAAARDIASESAIAPELLESPNNILGFEYTKYIIEHNLDISVNCLKRRGNSYNDQKLTGIISSATSIRLAMNQGQDISEAVPKATYYALGNTCVLDEDDVSGILHYKLLQKDDFSMYLDCSSDLSNKINNTKKDYRCFTDFAMKLKTKNMPYTRITRVLCHILLGIKTFEFEEEKAAGYVRYLRLLGFSERGSTILGNIKKNATVPIITSPEDYISRYDIISSDIYRLLVTEKTGKILPNEYTRKFDLTNI